MLNLRNKRYYIIGFLFLTPQLSSAQIEDLIEEQIKGYVTNKAEDYIDDLSGGLYRKAQSFYYNPIGTIWESYIQSDVQRSVNAKAGELKNFKVNEKELSRLRTNFGIGESMPTDQKTMFMPIRYGISESFTKSLTKPNLPLSKMVNKNTLHNYIDSLKLPLKYNHLEEALNQSVIDSIELFNDLNIKDTLIKDINNSRGLPGLLNRHPELVRVYANSINTDFRASTSHLYYWGVLADSHKHRLSKKAKLINPRNIKFESVTGQKVVSLVYDNSIIGTYLEEAIEVASPELLNLMPKPGCIYKNKETYMMVDDLGRLSAARLSVKTQGKSIEKTKTNFKELAKAANVTNKNDLYTKILKKLKEQPSMAFIVDTGNQLNDAELSRLKKLFKDLQKNAGNAYIDIVLDYNSGSDAASIVKIEKSDTIGFAESHQQKNPDSSFGIKERELKQMLIGIVSKKNVYHGSIDGKYPIVMNFCLLGNKEKGTISGDYFYSKFGNTKRMTIEGIYTYSTFVFDEFDDLGKKYGQFTGTISGNRISGKFIKDGREMPFSMATTNEKFKKLEEKVAEVTNIDIKNNEERKAIASHISNTKSTDNPYSFYLNILSKRYLTKNDLTGKTNEEINILKNMIYAYHGYRFNRDDLLQYFSQYSWYNPTTKDASVVYERFSKAEKYNVDFLLKNERK